MHKRWLQYYTRLMRQVIFILISVGILIILFGCDKRINRSGLDKSKIEYSEVEIISYNWIPYDLTNKDRMLKTHSYAVIDSNNGCKFLYRISKNGMKRCFRTFQIDSKKLNNFIEDCKSISHDTLFFSGNYDGYGPYLKIVIKNKYNKVTISGAADHFNSNNFFANFYNYIDSCGRVSNTILKDTSEILNKRNSLIKQISESNYDKSYIPILSFKKLTRNIVIDTLNQ
jgi:hypothetical protein